MISISILIALLFTILVSLAVRRHNGSIGEAVFCSLVLQALLQFCAVLNWWVGNRFHSSENIWAVYAAETIGNLLMYKVVFKGCTPRTPVAGKSDDKSQTGDPR